MFFLDEAVKTGGVDIIQAKATTLSIENDRVNKVHAIHADGTNLILDCDNLIIAAGPWTGALSKSLLPKPLPITSYAGHSILVKTTAPLTTHCLFITLDSQNSPYRAELFAKPNGRVYICGINDTRPLPKTPVDAIVGAEEIAKLKHIADVLLIDNMVEKEQLCFRPMTEDGEPFVGPTEIKGVWLGSGHSFWGISLGPGTGKILSEMVLGEQLSVDVSELSLDREIE
jgi:glycine/D-amino acid oxidase-like deaminating enzyme